MNEYFVSICFFLCLFRTVLTLFDFTRLDQLDSWIENSDTIKPSGMSKAILVIQKTQIFQRAVLFTLFNPKPNGSGFAAIRCDTNFDLKQFQNIMIKCRAQGINQKYKMLLKHKGLCKDAVIYGQVFTVIEHFISLGLLFNIYTMKKFYTFTKSNCTLQIKFLLSKP